MWVALLDILRGGDPLKELADLFGQMLALDQQMAAIVEPHVFTGGLQAADRKRIYAIDIEVNKLERDVRKRLVTHLTLNPSHVPYCLLLMTLIKDAERVGDYIKNVTEVSELGGGPVPAGPLRDELADLVRLAMLLLQETPGILERQDRERATELIQTGRQASRRCDRLLKDLAKTEFSAPQVTAMVLLTRFYKRIGAHLVNVLSSVVMPLHKVDFFDEKLYDDR